MQKIIQKSISAGALPVSVTYCAYGKKLIARITLEKGHYGWDRHERMKDSLCIYLRQGHDLAAELGRRGVVLTPEGRLAVEGQKILFDNLKTAETSTASWPLLTDMPDELI